MLSDVVVVGAGPAGAATAILLAREGLSVVLLDRARFPRDKICGEYLSPKGSRILERLGVLARVEARGARPLRGMRILGPDGTLLVGDYPLDHARSANHPHALAVRRRVLDSALVERAREVGVSIRERMRVVDLLREGTRVTGVVAEPVGPERQDAAAERFSAPLVVAADGRTSVIVERLGLRRPHPWLHRLALVADVEGAGGDPERGEIVLAPPTYSILNPVGAGVGNLSLVIPIEEARRHKGDLAGYFDGVTRALPGFRERLRDARRTGPVRALGPLGYRVDPPREDGVLLAGDAAGFLDPFTGEGLHRALVSAELAAGAILAARRGHGHVRRAGSATPFAAYERAMQRRFLAKDGVSWLVQAFLGRPALFDYAARRVAARPAVRATMGLVMGDLVPAGRALDPRFLAALLAP
jgi:flavin-dependent dehydrogenase